MANALADDWLELAAADGDPIRVRVVAHPSARRLRLTVTTQGARLSYPPHTRPALVTAFLRRHADWLRRKLEEYSPAISKPPLCIGVSTEFPLRGDPIRLDWAHGPYPHAQLDGHVLTVTLPPGHPQAMPVARGLLGSFLEAQMRRDLSRWLADYIAQLGLAPTALRIRPMKSLWGSLDTRERINLDLALVLAPPDTLRYVLVHELSHLKVRNHSPHFWAQVERLFPAWRKERIWLRHHGAGLKTELARLIAPAG